MEKVPSYGMITVSPDALGTIVRLTALAVPGVARLTPPLGLKRVLGLQDGFQITVQDGNVRVDLHIVAEAGRSMLALAHQIQDEVARAIEDLVGLQVEAVNVTIEDIVPAPETERTE